MHRSGAAQGGGGARMRVTLSVLLLCIEASAVRAQSEHGLGSRAASPVRGYTDP